MKTQLHIRWMIKRDTPEVLDIEGKSFEFPWSEEDFIRCLRQRNCIGMVAEFKDQVVGYSIYELHKTRIQFLNIAVHPDFRLRGVGRSLVENRVDKLSHERRNKILVEVRETNLDAQKFFSAVGFRATSIFRGYYDNTREDAYLFQYRLGQSDIANSDRFQMQKEEA